MAVTTLLRRPHFGGVVLGLLCWWLSLTPTLLPRSWAAQAAISAIWFVFGYAVGTLAGYLVHLVLRRIDRQPGPTARRIAWIVPGAVAAVVTVAGLVIWPVWQNDQRALVTLDDISSWVVLTMLAATIVVIAVLMLFGRLFWKAVRAIDRWFDRHFSRPVALATTVVVVVGVGWVAATDVVWGGFVDWANDRFAALDTTTAEGIVQPESDTVSGGPGSLVEWDDLGLEGRTFVAQATNAAELRGFHGTDVDIEDPIRVYVGQRSGESVEEQADLAVRELERTGGFDRAILCVTTTTGTGWVDPASATALEQIHRGDTAIATIQYSFLPSWIAFLADPTAAAPAGSVLFNAIYDRWVELPAEDRPQLVVFGESLGSYGAEAAFAGFDAATSIANMVARTDGVLFTGPTEANSIWSKLTEEREPGSPVWRPVIDGGQSLRVVNNASELVELDPGWAPPRILYVHHPSDPVGSWSWETIWSRPEWTESPIGYDVPQRVRWFPFITWVQEVADLMAGFSAPPGYGHDYSVDFVGAWATVTQPDDWTSDDTVALSAFLADADE